MQVIIIGAGLGGLCLAQGLKKHGLDVTVYERERSLTHRGQGYRLHINAIGQASLRACLPDNTWRAFVDTCSLPTPTFFVANEKLSRKFSVNIANTVPHTPATTGSELIADRLTMRTILSAGLGGLIHFGRQFVRFENAPNGKVTVHFTDGGRETADVLIGADGINSAVRTQYLPKARAYDTQLRSIIAKVPLGEEVVRAVPPMLLDNLFSVVIGPTPRWVRALGRVPELIHLGIGGAPKHHCAIGPFRFRTSPQRVLETLAPDVSLVDARDYAMCTFGARLRDMPVDDQQAFSMTGNELKEMALRMLEGGGWDPAVHTMIKHWDADTVTYQAIRSAVPVSPWESTNVTVMGDAIHAMSPTGGQGANTAYHDARNILKALLAVQGGASVQAEIGGYEEAMRKYSAIAIRESVSRGSRLVGQLPLPRH